MTGACGIVCCSLRLSKSVKNPPPSKGGGVTTDSVDESEVASVVDTLPKVGDLLDGASDADMYDSSSPDGVSNEAFGALVPGESIACSPTCGLIAVSSSNPSESSKIVGITRESSSLILF